MGAVEAELFLGIDVGTYETKGVAVDASGAVVARARYPHAMSTPAPGYAEHDAERVWWRGLANVSNQLMADQVVAASRVRAVGVSGIGPCVLPTDVDLNPLRPAILYGVDTRAAQQIESLTARLGEEVIFARSGNRLTSQSAGPKIQWIKEREPDVHARAAYFLTSQSFLVARLTGNVLIDHGTAGYFHPLYDLTAGRWDVSGCEDFIDEKNLPTLAWATDIAGPVTSAAAEQTGIPVGTPVIVGTTDAPAEAVSSSVVRSGDMMLMYGSSTYMIEMLDRPVFSDVLWSAPFVFPGSYVLSGGTATAGTLTHWMCDLLDLRQSAANPAQMFTALLELARESVPGARGLIFLPYFSGERTPLHDPNARGVIAGLTLRHGRADIARAMLEGISHSIAAALNAYEDAGQRPRRIYAVGGGTKNELFLQTVSDITGVDQVVADTDGAAFGDAALAAYATGHFPCREDILRWCSAGQTVSANPQNRRRLRADHEDFQTLYQTTRELVHRRTQE